MNPRDQLAKDFLVGLCANTDYTTSTTPELVSMAYEVADEFLKHIDVSCSHCHAKPDAEGKTLHVSGCPGGWPE